MNHDFLAISKVKISFLTSPIQTGGGGGGAFVPPPPLEVKTFFSLCLSIINQRGEPLLRSEDGYLFFFSFFHILFQ